MLLQKSLPAPPWPTSTTSSLRPSYTVVCVYGLSIYVFSIIPPPSFILRTILDIQMVCVDTRSHNSQVRKRRVKLRDLEFKAQDLATKHCWRYLNLKLIYSLRITIDLDLYNCVWINQNTGLITESTYVQYLVI